MLMFKSDQWPHLYLACEINSYFMLLKFSKLSFGLVGTPTCAKFIDYAVKTRRKHKRWWKRIIWMKNPQRTRNTLHPTPVNEGVSYS